MHATPAYPDVSLEAHVGEIVAIVGRTGAGQTGLGYLLPRFHRLSVGRKQRLAIARGLRFVELRSGDGP